jgi:uncharacterized phiE125 gp8 family phage protein
MVGYNSVIDIEFYETEVIEPVTLTEAKDFCKVDIGTDDTLITSLITASRVQLESYSGIGLVNHNIVATLNNINGDITIPYGPIYTINNITDIDGNVLILDTDYFLSGTIFKKIRLPKSSYLVVNYDSGYSADNILLPEVLKLSILNQIYYLYDNRSVDMDGGMSPIAKTLINPYKRV